MDGVVGEVAGPVAVHLGAGQPRPFAGVTLAEAGIHEHGADAQFGGELLGGVGTAHQVGRSKQIDGPERTRGKASLPAAGFGQRRVGLALPASERVPFGLAMTHEQDAGHGPPRYPDEGAGSPRQPSTLRSTMPVLRLFAAARDAAGTGCATVPGSTVEAVLDGAVARFGTEFARVAATAQVWCNGAPADPTDPVCDADEVAVLPPVSGGAR